MFYLKELEADKASIRQMAQEMKAKGNMRRHRGGNTAEMQAHVAAGDAYYDCADTLLQALALREAAERHLKI